MIELPTGWRRLSLAELGDWFGGGTPSKGRTDFWENGTVPWLSPKDMGPGVIQSTQDHITDAAVVDSSVRRVPGGSVAVVVRSGILERTLPIAVVPFEVTLNQDMKALVPRSDLDARWVAWGLRSLEQEVLRRCRKSGTTVASLDTKALMAQELPVPPLEEQRRIVEILEDHLSRLDSGARLVNDTLGRSEALQRSWLSEWLGHPEPDQLFTVGERLEAARGGWSRGRQHEVTTGGVPYLKMHNITRKGSLDLTQVVQVTGSSDDVERFAVRAGDVLFNSKNSGDLVGKTSVASAVVAGWTFNENIMRLRFDEGVIPEFAGMWFQAPRLRQAIRSSVKASTNVAAIYMNQLRQMPMWVPSLPTQESLLEAHGQVQVRISRLAEQLTTAQLKQSRLRRSLLEAASAGRLT